MKILVIKFRNIGDVLLASPLLSRLRATHERAEIHMLVKSGTEAVVAGHPVLARVWVLPRREAGESALGHLRRQWAFARALRRERFDIVFNTTEGDRGIIFAFLSGARRRIGYLKPGDKWWRRWMLTEPHVWRGERRHNVYRNLMLLPPAAEAFPVSVTCPWDEADWRAVASRLEAAGWRPEQPLVHVHPVSRWFFKCWPDERMAAAIDHLQIERGARVVLTSGPDVRERERLAAIAACCHRPPLDLGGRLSLKEVAALSAHSRLFFGVDTAPMHMAAAVGTPVVALFGPSGVFEWGPWPNGARAGADPYPARNGVQAAGPHVAIQKAWECVPCGRDGCDGSKESRCLDELAVEEVLPHIDRALQLASSRD